VEEALLSRLRASAAVIAAAGAYNGRPTIDYGERVSNADAAFPAAVLSIISPGASYDHGGRDGLSQPRLRCKIFGVTPYTAWLLARAITDELETAKTVNGVRFHRARVAGGVDLDPEDIEGGLTVFPRVRDFFLPYTL